MSIGSKAELAEAIKVLDSYHRRVVEKMASEIVEHKEDFKTPLLGNGEAMLERYQRLLVNVCWTYSHLRSLERGKTELDMRPLRADEFRCFQCRAIISADEIKCPSCGWSWEKVD